MKGFFGAKQDYDEVSLVQLRSELTEFKKGTNEKILLLERKAELHDNAIREIVVALQSHDIGEEIKKFSEELSKDTVLRFDEDEEILLPSDGSEDPAIGKEENGFLDESDSDGSEVILDGIDDDDDETPIDKLILKFEEMKNDNISLEEKIARLEQERQQLLISNADLKHELTVVRDEKETIENDLKSMREKAEKAERELLKIVAEKDRLQRELDKYEAERKKLEVLFNHINLEEK